MIRGIFLANWARLFRVPPMRRHIALNSRIVSCLSSVSAIAVPYAISCYSALRYTGTDCMYFLKLFLSSMIRNSKWQDLKSGHSFTSDSDVYWTVIVRYIHWLKERGKYQMWWESIARDVFKKLWFLQWNFRCKSKPGMKFSNIRTSRTKSHRSSCYLF